MSQKIRYGLISTAEIGFSAHVPAAETSPNSEIVAVSSRNKSSAEAKATEHNIPLAFGSYQEMIDSDAIDAVINTLPNSMHHEWTIKAAQAGKHVLCEKPLAASMDEARVMAKVAQENGILLVEGFTPRWNEQLRTIRSLMAEGEIGEVIRIDTCLTFTRSDPDDIRLSKELAGGSLMDAGGYCVYASRFLMGAEPTHAAGFQRIKAGHGVDTTFSGLLNFPSGAVANVWSSLEAPDQLPITVVGTEGIISLQHAFDEDESVVVVKAGQKRTLTFNGTNRFQVQLDEFSDCVLTGKQPEFPVEDAIRNMAAILALYQSARQGIVVEVDGL